MQNDDKEIINLENTDNNWFISYGDMVTLLLAFFIILFSVQGKMSESLEKNHNNNIANKLGTPPEGQMSKGAYQTRLEENQIIVEFPNLSFFDSGQIKIRNEASEALQIFAQKYLPFAGKFTLHVVGFTDDTPVRQLDRPFKDNLELSVLRAVAAQRVLQKSGIPLLNMRLAGYGIKNKNHSINSPLDQSASRRVLLILEPKRKSFL